MSAGVEEVESKTDVEMETDQEEAMVEPTVDEELLGKVVDMGFPELRAKKALLAGSGNVEAALEWCLNHENDADIDAPIPLVKKSDVKAKKVTGETAKSIKCVETGRAVSFC